METVNTITSAASRAIWGDPDKETSQTDGTSEEPRSGETGDVSTGEPYDKGNLDEPTTSASSNVSSTDNAVSSSKDLSGNTSSTLPIRSEPETSKIGVTSAQSSTPLPRSDLLLSPKTTSTVVDTSSVAQDTSQAQGSAKPTAAPVEGSEAHKRIAETKSEAEEAATVDTSGPGLKPLSEIKKDAPVGGSVGDDGPQKESLSEGTGEKYVKSTGLKADGGDFDASQPGSAKEADRFLETKGIHREVAGKTETIDESNDASPGGTPEKTGKLSGLKERIKAKLHKNKSSED